jgi:hypothetical protein
MVFVLSPRNTATVLLLDVLMMLRTGAKIRVPVSSKSHPVLKVKLWSANQVLSAQMVAVLLIYRRVQMQMGALLERCHVLIELANGIPQRIHALTDWT